MSPLSRTARQRIFVWTTAVCVALAAAYLVIAARRARVAPPVTSTIPGTQAVPAPSPSAPVSETVPSQTTRPQVGSEAAPPLPTPPQHQSASNRPEPPVAQEPRVFMLNMRDSPNRGTVESSGLGAVDARQASDLHCERVHVSGSKGVCLSREFQFLTVRTVMTLVNGNLEPLFTMRTEGIPTRARVSPDGRRAAFTVFVTGHSYSDSQMSTATFLIDTEKHAVVGNLEEFAVVRDGSVITAMDFNYWGVTFGRDSNFFYATLRTSGVNYLVRGDVAKRMVTVVHQGVECPALSPDETRVAFKKLVSRNDWRLTVLDLRTKTETPLAETRSVDDQPEWLDDSRVLYAVSDPAPWMSVMVVPADGTGEPAIFAKGAASPAIVR